MNINQIITDAFENARNQEITKTTQLKINRQRSQHWVESLAETFRKVYKKEDNYRVFSKYHDKNKKDFGLNELLFDISVCHINNLLSPIRKVKLHYIEKAFWLVESEMAKDTRQLLYDFNKLVIGDAENKLFVGPLTKINNEIFEIFKSIGKNCKGNLFVALIPHPDEWNSNNEIIVKKLS